MSGQGAAATTATTAGQADAGGRVWRDTLHLLAEFWRAHALATLATILLHLAGSARQGLYVLATGGLIDALTGAGARSLGGERSPAFWLLVYVGASVLEEAYWLVSPALNAYLLDHGSHRIERRVLERAGAVPLIRFEDGAFFDRLRRAHTGMGERLPLLYGHLLGLAQALFGVGSIVIALGVVHPLLPVLIAGGSLPMVWFQGRVATLRYEVERRHTENDRKRGHLRRLLTDRESAPEVRLFGTGPYLLDYWLRLREEVARDTVAAERRRGLNFAAGSTIAGVAYAAGLLLVSVLILRGQVSVGGFVAVSAGALVLQEILGGALWSLRDIHENTRFLGDLFDFLRVARAEVDVDESAQDSPVTAEMPADENRFERGMAVEAEGLTFAYPGSPVPVVRDVSLRIARGERIAIVGENGAGKTTLVKLLVGLYRPDSGTVRLDGEEAVGARALALRRRMAAVFQDYAAYQLTARENVGFGDLARMGDEAALDAAAERAGIAPLLRALPAATDALGEYDAFLGRQFGETELSGGQWQRVALARAFFRDADLLILDEPTAALDPLAELALFERFAALTEGRTAIMISHRLGAARLADRVLVLREGRIVEDGHHIALVASGGEYAKLFAAQAQWYR